MFDLKRCPFCGAKALNFKNYSDEFAVYCLDRGAEGPVAYGPFANKEEAAALWNSRNG